MKKLLSVMLIAVMVLSFAACGNSDNGGSDLPEVDLQILMEEDENMKNTYSLLAVDEDAPFVDANGNAVANVEINEDGAEALINWMLSEDTAKLIADYGKEDFGDSLFYNLEGAPVSKEAVEPAEEDDKLIRMSTTTSVNDSGLLGYLIPLFEDEYGYDVEIFSAGTGKAIANAQCGNADLILVHSKDQEQAFIDGGFADVIDGQTAARLSFMYNYFVLCGPEADPAAVKDAEDVLAAFKAIADTESKFISRGDQSGTHTKELKLWSEELGITVEAESFAEYSDWYISSNAGMGACLLQASEQGAYILSDKATFLTFVANGGVVEAA